MKKKLFSIITVSFNAASTIEKTIMSVLKYKNSQIEYIVIDGGSTDGTVDLLNKYSPHIDNCISEPDNGIYYAMNKGINITTGKWILFLGADDLLNIDVSKIQSVLTDGVTYYGNVRMISSGTIYDGEFNRYKILRKNICHQAIIYYGDVLRLRNFDTRYKIASDYEMNLFLFGTQPEKMKYVDVIVSDFNDTGISSKNTDNLFRQDLIINFIKYYPIFLFPIYPFARLQYYFSRIPQYINKIRQNYEQ